jgi:hypothetical protein
MNWMLFIIIASTTMTDKVINSTTIPMATEQLCDAAKTKMIKAYQQTQSLNFAMISECLQTR